MKGGVYRMLTAEEKGRKNLAITSALSPCPYFEYKGLASNTFFSCSVTVIIRHIFNGLNF